MHQLTARHARNRRQIGLALVAMTLALSPACLFKKKDSDADTDPSEAVVDEGPLRYEPDLQWDAMTFEDLPVAYYVPDNPRGFVYAFHGSGTDASYAIRIETVALLNELIAAGFGFVATSSFDRDAKVWDTSPQLNGNDDLPRLFALRDEIIGLTDLDDDTPLFAFGFSNGGGMTGTFATVALEEGLPMRATAPHMSSGGAWGLDGFPIIWVLADNDPIPSAESLVEERSGPTALYHCHEEPIDALYFTKNTKVTEQQSIDAQQAMVSLDMLDDKLFPRPGVNGFEDALAEYEAEAGALGAFAPTSRTEEIRVAWAMHRMSGLYSREVRDFFIDNL